MRRAITRVGSVGVIALAGVLASSTITHATTGRNDEYNYRYLLEQHSAVALPQPVESDAPAQVGDGLGTLKDLINGANTVANLYSKCEASKASFPECLIDGGPSLNTIQDEIKGLSDQITAFESQVQKDFTSLNNAVAAISRQGYKAAAQQVLTETQDARNGVEAASKNYNAFAQCQLKFYSQSTDQCAYYDSDGVNTLTGPANQQTLDAIKANLLTGVGIQPNNPDHDRVTGDHKMMDALAFFQIIGGQYTNPWNCAGSADEASNLLKTCGLMGNFFANQVAGERSDLGVALDVGKIVTFRPTFVNQMNLAATQAQSLLSNYILVRSAGAALVLATSKPTDPWTSALTDLQSILTGLATSGSSDPGEFALSPVQVAATYSGPPTAYPGGSQPGYQLGNNWSFFAGATTNAILVESLGGNQVAANTDPGAAGGTLPTEAQATAIANDMAAVGQTWSKASTATAIKDEPGLYIYPPAQGTDGTNPQTAGRLWTAPQTVYNSIVNSAWDSTWGTYFWNVRLNAPAYNSNHRENEDSGTAEPQSITPFITRAPVGIAGQTQPVQESLIFNVFDSVSRSSAPLPSVQMCEDKNDAMCNLKSSAWSGNGHVYEDIWLASTCNYGFNYNTDETQYNCDPDRQPVGSNSVLAISGMSGIPGATNWRISNQQLGGILRLPKDQNAASN